MLLVQEFLHSHTLAELDEKYHIHARRHGEFPNLVQLKYDQIESPMGEPIVQQCRGIILDEADGWRVVAYPMGKFFNAEEGHAAPIDWATAVVQEKVDGSLILLYHYRDGLRVATSGMPDAAGDVNGLGLSFSKLFWDAWSESGWRLPADRDYTYMFELTSPWNRVVVPHAGTSLHALAMRNRDTGEEVAIAGSPLSAYNPVRSFPLQTLEDVVKTFDTFSPLQQEGYVVVDAAFHRIKVKHPGYVAIHHLKDGFGPRRMVELIRIGESSEVMTYFPEWKEPFEQTQVVYDGIVAGVLADYERLKDIPSQKDFALEAVKTKCSAALFQMRAKRITSPKEMFAKMPIRSLMQLLGLRDTEDADDEPA